jgi:hypothetical protein
MRLREQARGSPVRVLEQDEWHHAGVRFLGCTLWSDHRLFESAQQRDEGLAMSMRLMRDFSRIRIAADFPEPFSPAVASCCSTARWPGSRAGLRSRTTGPPW